MMPQERKRTTCLCGVSTMTQAMHARDLLLRAEIRAEVVQTDSSRQRSGCAYAVSYPCMQERIVRSILRDAGIKCQMKRHDLF